MEKLFFTILIFFISWNIIYSQKDSTLSISLESVDKIKYSDKEDSSKNISDYVNNDKHEVSYINSEKIKFKSRPRNIILFIGDGMGVSHVFATLTANGGKLNICNMNYIGFSQTQSANKYITDSAAGGSALATGKRVNNRSLSVDDNNNQLTTILELAERKGKSTGLVSTSDITDATPASFIAHQNDRNKYEDIALDFLKTDIEIFIGGGLSHFEKRQDGRNLTDELKHKGYSIFKSVDEIDNNSKLPMAVLTANEHNPKFDKRGDYLPQATQKVIDKLSNNKNGFFLMVEGSQVDWGSHDNDSRYVIGEMLDLDKAIGKALSFAAINRETLVILTADHETGGLSIIDGDFDKGMIKAGYSTTHHSGVMVPVFAFGPGAEQFIGIYKNTDVFEKMKKVMRY